MKKYFEKIKIESLNTSLNNSMLFNCSLCTNSFNWIVAREVKNKASLLCSCGFVTEVENLRTLIKKDVFETISAFRFITIRDNPCICGCNEWYSEYFNFYEVNYDVEGSPVSMYLKSKCGEERCFSFNIEI